MPVYNKRGILLLPKVIVLNPKDGDYRQYPPAALLQYPGSVHWYCILKALSLIKQTLPSILIFPTFSS